MSVPFADTTTWVPLAVLTASLLGSAHCVAMCGGLAIAATKTPFSRVAFHLGRLGGYLSLGFVAGHLGWRILSDGESSYGVSWISWVVTALLGALLVLTGFRVWRGKPLHVPLIPNFVLLRLMRQAQGSAWSTGFMTAFLPCGWLHAFVLGAVATQDAYRGAGFLFAFWLGTVPALVGAPWLIDRIVLPWVRRAPKIAAVMLVTAGLLSISVKLAPHVLARGGADSSGSSHHSCH